MKLMAGLWEHYDTTVIHQSNIGMGEHSALWKYTIHMLVLIKNVFIAFYSFCIEKDIH